MRISCFLFLIFLLANCSEKVYQATNYFTDSVRLDSSSVANAEITELIAPYKSELESKMNKVIGRAKTTMNKAQPESTLGNLIADMVLEEAKSRSKNSVDLAIVNYGGIRIPEIAAGDVTVGKIFELMPFDNYLVIVTVNGRTLESAIQHIASVGGWPVSGLQLKIKNGQASDISINGATINRDANYRIAVSDYLAEGGDNMSMLKDQSVENLNILFRDALIENVNKRNDRNQMLYAELENRIAHVD